MKGMKTDSKKTQQIRIIMRQSLFRPGIPFRPLDEQALRVRMLKKQYLIYDEF